MTPAELRDALEIERNTARKELARVEAERDAALAQAVALREALELALMRLKLAAFADETMEEIEAAEDDEEEPSGIAELNQAVIDKIEAALAAPAPRVYTREEVEQVARMGYAAGYSCGNGGCDIGKIIDGDVDLVLARFDAGIERLDAEGEAHDD
jgi:multidrug efflux pump subunit AcrA (membrane-fusion protein)